MSATAEVLPLTTTEVAEYSATAAGLAELRQQLEGATFDCTTTAGDKLARESRMALVKLRTTLEAKRKELKAPLLERGKLLDDEAKRITGEIIALETPIDEQIKAEERRREAIRAERERAERERLAGIQRRIDLIRGVALEVVGAPESLLLDVIAELQARDLSAEFDEPAHLADAEAARTASLAKLEEVLAASRENARLAAELRAQREEQERQRQAEEQRLAAERAELERQRQEQAAADAEAARVRREQQEAEDAARREQQAREDAERAERQRIEDERRAAEAEAERVELERIAAAQREAIERVAAEQEAERQRLAAAARELAEQQAAERAAAEQAAIDNASLHDAARDAVELLREAGYAEHITTRKLAAAVERAP